MNAVFDFVKAALPWIVIGLALAMVIASLSTGRQGLKKALLWPSICMFAVALMEYLDKDTGSATTWFVLGICFIMLSLAEKKKEDKEKEEKE